MHPAHTLHTLRGRIAMRHFNMPDQHIDFRDFCQHDVLDNMDCATLNSTCFALILFPQFNTLLNNMRPDNKIFCFVAICFNKQSTP